MKIIKLTNPNFDKNHIDNLMSKSVCFIGVFSKLCIHCKNMKTEWEKLKNKLEKLNCNALLLEIDSSYLYSLGNESLSGKINGLPTILVYKNNKVIKEYNGNRTSRDMLKFFTPYIILTNKVQNKSKNNSKNNRKNIIKKTTKKIANCKHKKNGINGCRICCSKFKNRKTYKKCKKLCMKN
tara:strand:+ start:728 stop:1270 length:543 start_codon:yes stop_codon:yes gene_type:complete